LPMAILSGLAASRSGRASTSAGSSGLARN
jgi:hypothetical protein